MPTYVLTYRTQKDYRGSPESMNAWNSWFKELGDSVRERGNPVFARAQLGALATDSVLGGYSLVEAANLDAAVEMAKTCPILASGGGVEVGELTVINE